MTLAAELERKGIHLALLVLPVAAHALAAEFRWPVLALLWLGVVVAAGLDIARRRHPPLRAAIDGAVGHLYREHEARHPLGATLYLLAVALCFTLFPRGVALAALGCFVFGDAAAALAGTAFGRHRLPNGKSLEGAVACFAASAAFGAAVGGWLEPRLGLRAVLGAAALGTVAELSVPRGYDNLAMPLLTGGALLLLIPGDS